MTTKAVENFQVFKYAPKPTNMLKEVVRLGKTDILFSAVQVIGEGGENNLHSHNAMDGLWMVLEGRARFYTTNDEVVAELSKYEGIIVPRNTPYWFESIGDEQLQLLQVEALIPNVKAERTDYEPLKESGKPYIGASGTIGSPQDGVA